MQETIGAKIVHALAFLAICAAIIYLGWEEPFRYRFMSAEQIASESRSTEIVDTAELSSGEWEPEGTALDSAPYRVRRGQAVYSKNFDPRRGGTSTEADRRNFRR